MLQFSTSKVAKLFNELRKAKLIYTVKQGLNKPSRIYLMNSVYTLSKKLDNNSEVAQNASNLIHSEQSKMITPNNAERYTLTNQIEQSSCVDSNAPDCSNSTTNNKEISNNNYTQTHLSSLSEYNALIERMKVQIDYETLINYHTPNDVGEIVNLSVDVIINSPKKYVINGGHIDSQIVKNRISNLSFEAVDKLLTDMDSSQAYIKNKKNYLITALYNASASSEV